MKFRSLSALRFGCFTNRTVTFSNDTSLHILYGPNETGKSTLLRALTDCLYGIPAQTNDNHQHDYQDLRLQAVIEGTGGLLAFQRRKGTKDTILDPDGSPLGEDALHPWLNGVDRQTFLSTFGLDHVTLREGGRSLVADDGQTGQSIFQATTGLKNIGQILKDLEGEADQYLSSSGRAKNRKISAAVTAFTKLEKEKSAALLRPRTWQQAVDAKREAKEVVAELQRRLRQVSGEREKLRRIKNTLPHVAAWKRWMEQLEELRDLPALPDQCTERRQAAEEQQRQAAENIEQGTRALIRLKDQLSALDVDESILACGDSIESLQQEVTNYRSQRANIGELKVRIASLTEQMKRHRQNLLPDADEEAMVRYRLSRMQRQTVEELLRTIETQQREVHRLESDWDKLQLAKAQRGQALAELPPYIEVNTVRAQVKTARSQGDLDTLIANEEQNLAAIENNMAIELRAAGFWKGSIADLVGLSLPTLQTMELYRDRFEQWRAKKDKIGLSIESEKTSIRQKQDKLQDMERQGPIVTEKEWDTARAVRDHGWNLIRLRLEGMPVSPGDLEGYTGGGDLADTFEFHISESDEKAKTLVRNSTNAAAKATLEYEIERSERRLAELKQAEQDLLEQQAELIKEWQGLWEPFDVEPSSPHAMQVWAQRIEDIRQKYQEFNTRRAGLESLHGKRKLGQKNLKQAWNDIDQEVPANLGWTELLAWSEDMLDGIEQQNDHRIGLLREEKGHAETETRTREDLARNREIWTEATGQWQTLLKELGWPQTVSPNVAGGFLQDLDVYFELEHQRQNDIERCRGLEDAIKELEQRTRDVHQRLKNTSEMGEIDAAILSWSQALKIQRQNEERRSSYLEALQEREEQVKEAQDRLDSATRQLHELLEATAVADVEGLRTLEERYALRSNLEKDRRATEKNLLQLGEGLALETICQEVEGIDQDQLPQQLQQLEEDTATLEAELASQRERLGATSKVVADMESGSSTVVVRAAQEQQALTGQLEDDVAAYVRARAAQFLLQRAIKNYLETNQTPILHEARRWFPTLTGGSFADLIVDYGRDDKPVLFGVRSGGDRVTVEGMSDGTQDQLYLALRLGSLAVNHRRGITMPFVLDDILVHFDDERAGYALQALEHLSQTNQVIFFTHHEHLLELAEEVLGSKAERVTL